MLGIPNNTIGDSDLPRPQPSHRHLWTIKRSRPPPRPGDLFLCCYKGKLWLAGRVIRDDTSGFSPGSGATHGLEFLVYVYRDSVRNGRVPTGPLAPDLLIPPAFVNRTPWTTGAFWTIEHRPLLDEEILPRHCFRFLAHEGGTTREIFMDEHGRELPGRIEPCGIMGLGAVGTVDHDIAQALGSP